MSKVLSPLLAASLLLSLTACAPWPQRPQSGAGLMAGTAGESSVVQLAREELGVPYHYGGDTPTGFDCSGLVYYVFRKAGLAVPRTATQQYYDSYQIPRSALQPGDLVFFRTGSGTLMHVGIYAGNDRFIHAPETGGVVGFANLDNAYWRARFLGGGRIASRQSRPTEEGAGR